MDPLIDAVLAGATGDFKKQYASQRETLTSEAVRTEATSTAGGRRARRRRPRRRLGDGPGRGQQHGRPTRGTGAEGQVRYYRLRLDLVREDDRWLTSDLQFVR